MYLLVIQCPECFGEGALTEILEIRTKRTDDFSILLSAIHGFGYLFKSHSRHAGAEAHVMANDRGEWRMLDASND